MTRFEILEHPNEHGQAVEALAHHQALIAHPPWLVTGDRGVHSAETEPRLSAAGVKLIAIPAAGPVSQERQTLEHTRRWKRGVFAYPPETSTPFRGDMQKPPILLVSE